MNISVFSRIQNRKWTCADIFILVSASGIILFFVLLIILRQRGLEWIVMGNNPDFIATDFQLAELWGQKLGKGVYDDTEIIYPPLTLLFFNYISRITTFSPLEYNKFAVLQNEYQLMILFLYIVLPIIWLYNCFQTIKIKKSKILMLMLCIICSVPMFAGAIEKCNVILYTIPLTLTALKFKESNNSIKRETALVFIALASAMKIFPAVLGIIYLKEKRFKEALRLYIYCCITILVPFIFAGGLEGIRKYLRNASLRNEYYKERFEYFKGLLAFFNINGILLSIMYFLFIALLIFLIIFTKNKFREYVFIASFIAFVPNNAFLYMLLWFLIPLIYLLRNESIILTSTLMDKVNVFLLANIFTIPTILGIITKFKMNYDDPYRTCVVSYIYFFAWLLLSIQIILEIRAIVVNKEWQTIKKQR